MPILAGIDLLHEKIEDILITYPFAETFLVNNGLDVVKLKGNSMEDYFKSISSEHMEDHAIDPDYLMQQFTEFVKQMLSFLGEDNKTVESITILPGRDKSGAAEHFTNFLIQKNEIVSIVGPTGSGKSRLLGDIEWAAQNDTPTGRSILINEKIPDKKWRYSSSEKLVAQLSQNMNFVMDMSVLEFLELHAESRMVTDSENIISRIIEEANNLAGEKFDPATPITALSGGQSRALMIADTAILSKSPIILIDEIENAGIDRKRALKLLLSEEKIVLMATHDPALALMGNRRIVIKNGGIIKIIETTDEEKEILSEIEELDKKVQAMREKLRNGEKLTA